MMGWAFRMFIILMKNCLLVDRPEGRAERPAGRLWLWFRLVGTKDRTKKAWIQRIFNT